MGRKPSNHESPLTARQAEALRLVMNFIQASHRPPVIRELGEMLGLTSTKAVVEILQALEKKGHIERLTYSSQIKILRNESKQPVKFSFEVVNG